MDLLKSMLANRQTGVVLNDPKPRTASQRGGRKKPTKTERAKEHTPGSRSMRAFIIEEKPSAKIVKEHFDAIIEQECESSSDEE